MAVVDGCVLPVQPVSEFGNITDGVEYGNTTYVAPRNEPQSCSCSDHDAEYTLFNDGRSFSWCPFPCDGALQRSYRYRALYVAVQWGPTRYDKVGEVLRVPRDSAVYVVGPIVAYVHGNVRGEGEGESVLVWTYGEKSVERHLTGGSLPKLLRSKHLRSRPGAAFPVGLFGAPPFPSAKGKKLLQEDVALHMFKLPLASMNTSPLQSCKAWWQVLDAVSTLRTPEGKEAFRGFLGFCRLVHGCSALLTSDTAWKGCTIWKALFQNQGKPCAVCHCNNGWNCSAHHQF